MYTQITEEEIKELDEISQPVKIVGLGRTKESTSYFSFHSLGLKPRRWQHVFWKKLDCGAYKRIMCVTSRQIGKTTAIAAFALKAAAYNLRPASFNKKTHIGIISATEEQSKKIMLDIRRLIMMGDEHTSRQTSGKIRFFYTNMIDDRQSAANNKTTITFKNGNTIVCLPPTPRVRGYAFSYLFIDEAAHIEDDAIYFEYLEPTTANTDGITIFTTSPNGMQGWFYELFDPDNKHQSDPTYIKMWFHYSSITEEPDFIESIEAKRKMFYETGRELMFKQEYDALFTAQITAFFDNEDIEKAIDPEALRLDSYAGECDMGVDFGMVHSKTVLTISAMDGSNIRLIYDYEYTGSDETLVQDIKELCGRFQVQRLIVDDCPEGHYVIQQLVNLGYTLTLMSFRAEKIPRYMALKKAFRKGRIKLYKNQELISQLRALQQTETPTRTEIKKPAGGRDDYPDSLLLSTYHLLDEGENFSTEAIIYAPMPGKFEKGIDQQWARLQKSYSDELKLWGGTR